MLLIHLIHSHVPYPSVFSYSRKKGAILNISSASGMYPVPLLTVYSASKVNVRAPSLNVAKLQSSVQMLCNFISALLALIGSFYLPFSLSKINKLLTASGPQVVSQKNVYMSMWRRHVL